MKFRLLVVALILVGTNALAGVELGLAPTSIPLDEFILNTQDLDESAWLEAWSRWETQNPEIRQVYEQIVFRGSTEARKLERLRSLRSRWKETTPRMLAAIGEMPGILSTVRAGFARVFPNSDFSSRIYLLPSAMSFNGKVDFLADGTPVLILGIDLLALRNDSIAVVAAHELIHLLHFQSIPGGIDGIGLIRPLWLEGYATLASGAIAEEDGSDVLLMDPELATKCAEPGTVAIWASRFLEILDTPENAPEIETHYSEWFLTRGTERPTRRGYCLGMRIIAELAKHHSFAELLIWDARRFSAAAQAELERLTRVTPDPVP